MIVVMILAIISAIVVPRVVDAHAEACESAIETDIQMMRRQIIVYTAQHGGRAPHLDFEDKLDKSNFISRLTGRTDPDGRINTAGSCGPYMKAWPSNPFIDSGEVAEAVCFGTDAVPPRDGSTGWYYNTDTYVISANSATGGEKLDPQPDAAAETPVEKTDVTGKTSTGGTGGMSRFGG
jgi:type II secretory pathway pseudopilin PulG